MKKKVILILLLFSISSSLFAQKRVTGIVKDAQTSDPIPGVNVSLKGTTVGTVTDFEGNYAISAPSDETVLVFSFIGYKTQEVTVDSQSEINVQLEIETQGLDEVVVVGYGTMKKSDVTGSVVSVSEDKLKGSVVANLDQALQGRAAGITAVQTSGQPGSSVSIRVRGQGTLRADASEPLYVVDGVPIQNVSQSGHSVGLGDAMGNGSVSTFSGLSVLNPSDILSVEILKDASATAIYGSRGANGVVLITTKKGRTGEAKFTYEGYYGVQEQVKRIDVMNLREFAEYSNDWAAETNGRDPRVELQDPSILGEGTNWQDAVFRVAPMQSNQISAMGGTDVVKYFISGSYYTQEGTVIGSDFERFSSRVNLDAQLKSWFKMGTNLMFTKTKENIGLNNSTEGIISVALNSSPDIPIYNTDGSWSGDQREGSPGRVNPIAKALDEENTLKRTSIVGTLYSDINFTKDLTLRTELGVDIGNSNAYHFLPTYEYGTIVNSTNSSSIQYNQNFFWQLKNYLTYNKTFGVHNVTAMVGQEVSEWTYENLRGASTGLSSNDIHLPSLGDPTTMTIGSGKGSGSMASAFTRANYSYDEKYLLTYTFRYDGSSNFGPENRWAPFHAFAASWRINNESFMESLEGKVSNFKIRAGWGQTGNANIGGYRWGASINKMPTGLGQGFRQSNIANPFITWEKQEQYNLGIDLGLFDNRIEMVIDLYDKTSTAMLMDMQLPSYMGTRGNASIRLNPPMGNFGEIENKGVEFTLNTRPFVGEFKWESELSLTRNKNKLLGLDGTPAAHIEGYGQWTDLVSLTEIGESLYNFYGYKVAGIYQNKEDIMNSPKTKAYPDDGNFNRSNTVWPGDIKYEDLSGPDGVPDGVIDEYDRTNIGSPLPKFTFGFNNTFSYKNFELNVFINGSYGNKILNYVGRSLISMESMWNNQLSDAVNRAKLEAVNPDKQYPSVNSTGSTVNDWYEDIDNIQVKNPDTDIPRAIAGDPNDNNRVSDRFIEDGSYLRFKNITLSYYVPKKLLQDLSIDNLRVYSNIQNMWTITKYTGFDPEVGASQTNDNVSGLDNGRYPSPRIYTFGLSITF
ncbi:SusC/RagA family TonB-linked outer membrane protein [Maribellus comscasis]|uniref:SusC/RagA family TonB-linked outer membrane protein n=1 Tax=Maribellus comscasis TaxID=2681766 RepID=A0A6I6JY63_9BACT|nr:TonB-dependent receptor [Maribellus comscasis]QGY44073.1 SusC/RagA family TonB-linked outer membrane protein [Maribellus comscasis]